MSSPKLVLSRRLRQTPFEARAMANGAKAFTVYNHMTLPSIFQSAEEDYAHLCEHVQIWDVAAERQVEVVGKDALALVELVTPRDISVCSVGQCMYAPLVDENGGMVNDPLVLKLAPDRFWLSIADSDVLLWLKGIAYGRGLEVSVIEPDVSPLAIQGPKADDLVADVVGKHIRDLRFFRFIEVDIAGTGVLLARSGWSGQGGFELYLQDSTRGKDLWDVLWQAGRKYNLRAGCPNLTERLESGLLSYGSDMTLENNPIECGLERFCNLDKKAEYMSRQALQKVVTEGLRQRLVHLMIPGDRVPAPRSVWTVKNIQKEKVGYVTSLAYSPRFSANLSFAMVEIDYIGIGQELRVCVDGDNLPAKVMSRRWV